MAKATLFQTEVKRSFNKLTNIQVQTSLKKLKTNQMVNIDHVELDIIASEINHQSVSKQIDLATNPKLKLAERLDALLANINELNSEKYSKDSGPRRNEASTDSSR